MLYFYLFAHEESNRKAERKAQALEPINETPEIDEEITDHLDSTDFDFLKDIEEDKEIYRLKVQLSIHSPYLSVCPNVTPIITKE